MKILVYSRQISFAELLLFGRRHLIVANGKLLMKVNRNILIKVKQNLFNKQYFYRLFVGSHVNLTHFCADVIQNFQSITLALTKMTYVFNNIKTIIQMDKKLMDRMDNLSVIIHKKRPHQKYMKSKKNINRVYL